MIRPAVKSDIVQMVTLGRQILENTESALSVSFEKAADNYLIAINDPNKLALVAIVNNRVVGVLVVAAFKQWFTDDMTAYDAVFHVHPSYPNKAPYLIKRSLKWVESRSDIIQFHLGITSGDNNRLRTAALYESLGFKTVGSNHLKIMR